ncbi:MAG TPA: MFS transporter [Tepidisphaeraceae bacterium]|jgi:MFS family permease
MTTASHPTPTTARDGAAPAAWLPLVVIVLAQIQMSFNINALPVSVGRIAEDLHVPATSIATAMVVYSLFVAALVMVGAKLGRMLGERLVFQAGVAVHAVAMGRMAFSSDARTMDNAQALAGVAAAAIIPTLVVLIAANYRGRQQALALGILAGAQPIAGALAFFIAGFLGSTVGWRYSFGMLMFLAIAVIFLSFQLQPVPREKGVRIDLRGAVLAATAIALISFGVNNLNSWGLVLAKSAAPFSPVGLSPAPFMVVIGVVMGEAFFVWSQYRVAAGRTPLLSLEVLDSREKRATIYALFVIGGLGPAVNFLIPLYIQIVQDRSTLFTAVAVVPYTAAIAGAAIFIGRLYDWLSPRTIGALAFVLVAAGLTLLGFTVNNQWGTPVVVLGLILTGLGEGSLLTLLFNLLVALSPRELAGDVGALRGMANNLSTGLGTAFASVIAVALLSLYVTAALNRSTIPDSLKGEVDLDNVNFVTNTHLKDVLGKTSATPEQVNEGVRINEEARLRALNASFLILAAIALLAIFPALALPKHNPVLAEAEAEPAPPDPALVPGPSNGEEG